MPLKKEPNTSELSNTLKVEEYKNIQTNESVCVCVSVALSIRTLNHLVVIEFFQLRLYKKKYNSLDFMEGASRFSYLCVC